MSLWHDGRVRPRGRRAGAGLSALALGLALTDVGQVLRYLFGVLAAIMEHFQSGAPVMAEGGHGATEAGDEFYDEADHDTVVTIKDLLETRVRPAVAGDGGDITFRGYKEGVVYLEMKGACSGCPSSTATLRNGVQNLFRHFLPEIREVQAI